MYLTNPEVNFSDRNETVLCKRLPPASQNTPQKSKTQVVSIQNLKYIRGTTDKCP